MTTELDRLKHRLLTDTLASADSVVSSAFALNDEHAIVSKSALDALAFSLTHLLAAYRASQQQKVEGRLPVDEEPRADERLAARFGKVANEAEGPKG